MHLNSFVVLRLWALVKFVNERCKGGHVGSHLFQKEVHVFHVKVEQSWDGRPILPVINYVAKCLILCYVFIVTKNSLFNRFSLWECLHNSSCGNQRRYVLYSEGFLIAKFCRVLFLCASKGIFCFFVLQIMCINRRFLFFRLQCAKPVTANANHNLVGIKHIKLDIMYGVPSCFWFLHNCSMLILKIRISLWQVTLLICGQTMKKLTSRTLKRHPALTGGCQCCVLCFALPFALAVQPVFFCSVGLAGCFFFLVGVIVLGVTTVVVVEVFSWRGVMVVYVFATEPRGFFAARGVFIWCFVVVFESLLGGWFSTSFGAVVNAVGESWSRLIFPDISMTILPWPSFGAFTFTIKALNKSGCSSDLIVVAVPISGVHKRTSTNDKQSMCASIRTSMWLRDLNSKHCNQQKHGTMWEN